MKSLMESPYGTLDLAFPEALGKLIWVEEGAWEEDSFRDPAAFFSLTALGGRMYYKVQKRAKAEELCNYCFGGRLRVVAALKAQIR